MSNIYNLFMETIFLKSVKFRILRIFNGLIRLERLNGIQRLWVQIPLRPTFYSYFKESFSGEYHIYIDTTLDSFCMYV